ncbi:rhomboid-related protein 4-like [Diadema antillarum]|uniref:rhomboid-related protein 4-like n=1 Tax=Diadema antillarum TaxID=105358 RepID=UPI003A85BC4B
MFRPRRRAMHRREGLGLLLLFHQLYRVGFSRIPPATLVTLAANILIYLRVLNPYIKRVIRSPSIKNVCVSTVSVWYKGDWPRLFLAAWFHLDDWHLYYNMVSFIWKGISLERQMGTPYFAYLILVFSALTNALLVGLNIGVAELLEDPSYITSCAAGFSGVLFALKVLTTYYTPVHNQRIMGLFSVPSRWACWVELVLIQLIVPRASFTGHLAGILVGLAYVKGPLKPIMDAVWHLGSSAFTGMPPTSRANIQSRTSATGYRQEAQHASGPTGSNWGRGYTTGRGSGSANHARPAPPNPSASSSRQSWMASGSGSWNGAPPTLPSYQVDDYTGGMSEEDQRQDALRRSRSDADADHHHGNRPQPSAPPVDDNDDPADRLYPDLSREHGYPAPPYPQNGGSGPSNEELRRRRLAHLQR